MATLLERIEARIETDLSAEQKRAVHATGKTVVLAGPGSGKTKVVAYRLARMIAASKNAIGGVAALSFTNNAIDEIASQLDSLGISFPLPEPHFLGTLDSFLHEYLFRPHGHLVMGCSASPEIVPPESYGILNSYLETHYRTITTAKGKRPIRWSDVVYKRDGTLALEDTFKGAPFWVEREQYTAALLEAKDRYAKDGLATHSDALYWCLKLIASDEFKWIGDNLCNAYGSWIIDEAQDTTLFHALILQKLWSKQPEVNVLVVGDPDQAIFEWNKAMPSYLPTLSTSHHKGWQCLSLEDNWRSSQLICNATHRFRNPVSFAKPSAACGEHTGATAGPVLLLFPDAEYVHLHKVLKNLWLRKYPDVANPKLAMVAWRNADVDRMLGGSGHRLLVTEFVKQFCEAISLCHVGDDDSALQIVEGIVCQLAINRPSFGPGGIYLPIGLEEAEWLELRALLLSDLLTAAETMTVGEFVDAVRKLVTDKCLRWWPRLGDGLSKKIRVMAKAGSDSQLLPLLNEPTTIGDVSVNTIHRMKGSTVDGIMLVGSPHEPKRPSDVNSWLVPPNPKTGICEEPRRLAYVAMTRPRRLLAVAIPASCGPGVASHRDWRGAGFTLENIADYL